MDRNLSVMGEDHSISQNNRMKKPDIHKSYPSRDVMPGSELWTDGLICAFEFVRGHGRKSVNSKSTMSRQIHGMQANGIRESSSPRLDRNKLLESSSTCESRGNQDAASQYKDSQIDQSGQYHAVEKLGDIHWVPIGWARISELVKMVQTDAGWAMQQLELMDEEDDLTVAELAAPYWERPAGPTWWCHVAAGGLMKSWRVPVRVAGGLLFELLGQSVGDPFVEEDDIPIVLRSWQAQNFLITALHIKGTVSRVNVLGITEVQELLSAGGYNSPRTVHEVIALLVCRLTRWDDRIFRKSIFGAADEIELKFMNRRHHEDMNLFSVILNQEIKRLSRQVIRVKWSLHAREEIVFELLHHLRGNAARTLLEEIRKSTREMMEEQEAVRGRLFTIQDVMQSTVRAWLQDRSLRVTHNLAVFGGCGLVLSIITGLFGINVDGIPGANSTPYAFGLFAGILVFIGVVLIAVGLLYLGLKQPITEEKVEVRRMELQELVKMFQHEAETHAQVHKSAYRNNLTPTSGDDVDYLLIQ